MKPMHESASIGLDMDSVFIFDKNSEQELIAKQSLSNITLLLQEFIEGYECEVPFFVNNKIHMMSPVGISINNNSYLGNSILTFDRSFNDDYEFYTLSDELEHSIINKIEETSIKIVELIGFNDYGRIDYRIDDQGTPHLMDIATSPYTTKHSSFAYSFSRLKLDYKDIYSTIIGLAYSRHHLKSTNIY
ncbi:hypothetical protein A3844_05945 [Paenibacillus helianthi]|uniref:ATP-grasp domain-containing protein n=2 Tax=Paenibacillus helianthi TaxID=1349432 RepID=A0ABX3ERZ0_9BACL|nr:hypothetical protein A3844_05945 [Paenibacillus helianthi]